MKYFIAAILCVASFVIIGSLARPEAAVANGVYTNGSRYDACVSSLYDPDMYNWLAVHNGCSTSLKIVACSNLSTSSGAYDCLTWDVVRPGRNGSTGLSRSEADNEGGFWIYPCPVGYNPVDTSGHFVAAPRLVYRCLEEGTSDGTAGGGDGSNSYSNSSSASGNRGSHSSLGGAGVCTQPYGWQGDGWPPGEPGTTRTINCITYHFMPCGAAYGQNMGRYEVNAPASGCKPAARRPANHAVAIVPRPYQYTAPQPVAMTPMSQLFGDVQMPDGFEDTYDVQAPRPVEPVITSRKVADWENQRVQAYNDYREVADQAILTYREAIVAAKEQYDKAMADYNAQRSTTAGGLFDFVVNTAADLTTGNSIKKDYEASIESAKNELTSDLTDPLKTYNDTNQMLVNDIALQYARERATQQARPPVRPKAKRVSAIRKFGHKSPYSKPR